MRYFLLCVALFGILPTLVQAANTTRVVALADMGLSEKIVLDGHATERHFYLPLPPTTQLENAYIEVQARYFHPFDERAAIAALINGDTVASHSLFKNSDSPFLRMAGLDDSARGGADNGEGIHFTIPFKDIKSKGGFVDLGLALTIECQDMRGREDHLLIDPKATRLVYTFKSGLVRDIDTIVTSLPRHPTILLPSKHLTPIQYETALRIGQGLSARGMQARYLAVPQIGEWVSTKGIDDNIDWTLVPNASSELVSAVKVHSEFKLTNSNDVSAWLIAHLLSRDGLAQVAIDAHQTQQKLMTVLRHTPLNNALKQRIGSPEQWLSKKTDSQANLYASQLAGQPILLVGEGKSSEFIASLWQSLSHTPLMGIEASLPLEKKNDGDFHFARNIPVRDIVSSGEWLIPLRLTDFPDGKWPDTFELNLMAAPSGDGQSPIASILLNDNLLMVEALHTDGKITRVTAQAPLYSIRANNVLKIQINRRTGEGACRNAEQRAPVQLLPSSFVTFRRSPSIEQFYMVQPLLAKQGEVAIPQHYLSNAVHSLSVVSSVLQGFNLNASGFTLNVVEGAEFKPESAFIAFETIPSETSQLVTAANGKLVVLNDRDHKLFDSTGLGELGVLQLVSSHGNPGVYVTAVAGVLPIPAQALEFGEGSLVVIDAQGIKLAVNLNDPDNDYELDEQNRSAILIFQHYRVWFVILGLLALPVLLLLGFRWYFRRKNQAQP